MRKLRARRYQRAVEKIITNCDYGLISRYEKAEQLQLLDEMYDDERRRRDNIG